MSAELLLREFDRIGDTTAAIDSLRRFVFEMAVCGRLVEQRSDDEPAAVLLERCRVALRQASTGSRVLKGLDDVAQEPYQELPRGWAWAPLGITGRIFNGNSVSESGKAELAQVEEGFPFIATKDVGYGRAQLDYDNGLKVSRESLGFKTARANSIIICSEGGSAGKKLGVTDREICFGNKLYANETWPDISPRYLLAVYQSPSFYAAFRERMTGIIGGIALSEFRHIPVPIPPLAEQRRIEAKVDELMTLCDQLEAAQKEREVHRDALRRVSLHRLTEPEDEPADVRFFLKAAPRLITKTEDVAAVRRTILDLAVRGQLVPQDPGDEPASEFLTRAADAKRDLRQRSKFESDWRDNSTCPFAAPAGWAWTPIDGIALKVTDGEHLTPVRETHGFYLLSARNVTDTGISLNDVDYVGEEEFRRIRKRCNPDRFDILISCSGSVGRVAIVDRDDTYVMVRSAAMVKPFDAPALSPYLALALRSKCMQAQMVTRSKATAQANLFIGAIKQLRVPLPPLAEQHRIVAKVDELMEVCEELEITLTSAKNERGQLLEALLHDAMGQTPRPVAANKDVFNTV